MDASLPSQGRDGLPTLKTWQALVDGGVRACYQYDVAAVWRFAGENTLSSFFPIGEKCGLIHSEVNKYAG